MLASGYNVTNRVHCKKTLDLQVFEGVRLAFAGAFSKIRGGVHP